MPIHPVLARELRQSKRLQKFFDALPESSRHQIDREVREVKKEETRLRRAQHAAEYLMEAMEAELNPPPLMKAAFRRNVQARQGWELMPQSLRRQYLIAIFHSRFPETRARWLKHTLQESAEYAHSHARNAKNNLDVEK
ncbi:MAG: YdeI/OmpD-associated family protein [Candidatus Angelobacter sp.]